MAGGGIVLGVADVLFPNWAGGIPPLLFLLGIALFFDVIVNQQAASGRMAPLAMQSRFIGFLIGAALSIAIPMLSGRA